MRVVSARFRSEVLLRDVTERMGESVSSALKDRLGEGLAFGPYDGIDAELVTYGGHSEILIKFGGRKICVPIENVSYYEVSHGKD